MSVKENSPYILPPGHPAKTAYGRFIRERGTLKIVLGAIALAILWFAYDAIHTHLMYQVKWPTLQPVPSGLTIVGLQDRDRPGWRHLYEARESSHAWQIREREDSSDEGSSAGSSDPGSEEAGDRGNNPGATHSVNNGAVVPVEKVLQTCPTVLTGAQLTGASIDEDEDAFFQRKYYRVYISLNDEGRSRYWQFSREHNKERLAFILNGEVMACPRMDNLDVSTLVIDPIWIKSDAERLRDFINNQKR